MSELNRYAARLEFDKVCAEVAHYAVCALAKEKIIGTEPVSDLMQAAEQMAATAALTAAIGRNGVPSLTDAGELAPIAVRAEKGGLLSMPELLRVRTALKNGRTLLAWKPEYAGEEMEKLFFPLYRNDAFERVIEQSILSETEMADTASPRLAEIRRKIGRAEQSIRERLDSIVKGSEQKYLQDAVVTMRGGRFVVPVRQEHRNELRGLVHDVSSSGSTYFIEPEAVVEANNTIVALKGEEAAEIERILYQLSAEVSSFADRLRISAEAVIDIDVCLAKARFAVAYDCTAPAIREDGCIRLVKARHPLISRNKVVPIDVAIGEDYRMLVVTGPNTGGKTVTLKTVGLLCLMAASGMMIPAAEGSEVSVFDHVLVDIGDEQSIEQSLSTFSGHIRNIIELLAVADDRSLVLLDELGAGTDPAEGAALATAILERFRRLRSVTLATTHYGEIKLYALETDGVQNASCEFDVRTLSPTYRITVGIPGRSNAFLIGEKLGLDSAIIDEARGLMSGESRRFEDVLSDIEQMKSELSERIRQADARAADAALELKRAKEESARLRVRAEKELQNAEARARQLVGDVTSGAYRLLDEIKKLDREKEKNTREAAQRARAIARNEAARLYDLADGGAVSEDIEEYEPVEAVKVGDMVMLRTLGRPARVLTLPDAAGNLEVAAGSIKSRVSLSQLGRLEKTPGKKRSSGYDVDAKTLSRAVPDEINLIGLTAAEASLETERYISTAIMAGLGTVRIIHGRGTGALRAAVQQTLRRLGKKVKSFRLGRYGEGEDGVTVVELK